MLNLYCINICSWTPGVKWNEEPEGRIQLQCLLVSNKAGPVNHMFRLVFHPLVYVTEMAPRITQRENCFYVSGPSVSITVFFFYFNLTQPKSDEISVHAQKQTHLKAERNKKEPRDVVAQAIILFYERNLSG